MLKWVRKTFGGRDHEEELLRKQVKQLEARMQEMQWNQQKLKQALQENQQRLKADRRRGPKLEDIAIEEKVDAARLSTQLEQLQAKSADTTEVRERIAALQEVLEERQEALKEDITTMDAAIHDAVESMRQDLIDSFRKEFLALETTLTYEMDALDAKSRWEREDLAERIDAIRDGVDQDLADLEAETIATLQTTTAALERQLADRMEEMTDARDDLEQRVTRQLDALQEKLEKHIDDVPDAATILDDLSGDTGGIEEGISRIQQRLAEQRDMVEQARKDMHDSLDTAVDTVRDEEIQPLRNKVAEIQEILDAQIDDLEETVQQKIDRLAEQESADVMRLESRLDTLEDRVEQEMAASETVQAAKLQDAREQLENRMAEHEDQLADIRDTITSVEDRITDLTSALEAVQGRIDEMAAADEVEAVRTAINGLRDELDTRATVKTASLLQEHIDALHSQVRTIQEIKADEKPVKKRLHALAKTKADQDAMDEQLSDLSDDIRSVRNWLEDARETLDTRLTELEEEAARADTVADLQTHLDAVEDAAARQKTVQEKLEEIRGDIAELRQQTVSMDDITFMRKRVQQIREQLASADRSRSQADGAVEDVTRDEFTELQEYVAELSGLVLELVNMRQASVELSHD